MKYFKKNLLLLGILIIVMVFYFTYKKILPQKEKLKEEKEKIFSVEKEKINRIYIKTPDKEIELVKENENWIIKEKGYECDKDEIETILNKIISLDIEKELGEISELSIYGLLEPKKLLEFKANGENYILYVGDDTPTGSSTYVTKDKKNILLVYKWDLNSIFEKNIFDLRDKRVIMADISSSDVSEIEARTEKINFLVKKSGDNWKIEEPLKDIADNTKIERIIDNLIDKKVKNFEEEKKEEDCGLKEPKSYIRIKAKNKDYFLFIGKVVDNSYYAKSSLKPYIFTIEKGIIEDIPEKINELREKKIFKFDTGDFEELFIEKGKLKIEIKKEKGRYYLVKNKKMEIVKEKVEDYLDNLKYIEIEEFLDNENDLKKYNLSPPDIKIIIKDAYSKNEVYFGNKDEKNLYGYIPERNVIFKIPAENYEKIFKQEDYFISKK